MKKLRISAPALVQLRSFLADAPLDFGCRPVAMQRDGRFETYAYGAEDAFSRLRAARTGGIEVEDLGTLRSAASRMTMASTTNRFADGDVPRGYGRKE